jgi:glyoxylase-like metal-dependent hydrolase (beta-lactamase superfamily II)
MFLAAQQQEPVWDGNKVEMISEKLASDVYAFYDKNANELNAKGGAAATSGGLIVGERGSLLIETLLNKRLNTQVQELSKKLSNNKPILFAVNTSSHGDHWYGNMYLPATTLIIQHIHAKQYIDEHLDHDKQFMIQNFGTGRGIEEIEARTGDILVEKGSKIRIDLGGKLVEIIDFGFGQTGGDLFVWEPQSKVLWTGNPIVSSKPSLPWLLDGHLVETLGTIKKVYEFLPSDARIIPGHGVVIKREDLQWHIDYLTAVQNNVQKAINQGLNQEQTVKQTTDAMQNFRGYVLFDWIHSALNIPKAFEELKCNHF